MVTHLMGADLNNIVKTQRLSDDHVQFLVYQILRGLKACTHIHTHRHTLTVMDMICIDDILEVVKKHEVDGPTEFTMEQKKINSVLP